MESGVARQPVDLKEYRERLERLGTKLMRCGSPS
jgi:hypothetical protein